MGKAVMMPSSARALTMAGWTPSSAKVLGVAGAISVDDSSTSTAPFSEMVLRVYSVIIGGINSP